MSAEAALIASVVLLGLAVMLCIVILHRSRRAPSAIAPILEQRLLSIEGAIGRSDTTIREEFGRGRDETREGSRSLREEVTGLFGNLGGALRATLGEKLDTVSGQITTLTEGNERRQEVLRKTVAERLDAIRKENTEKLDQMRQTVDE
jgi:DNA anti-recombination protein RmuC